MDQCRRGLQPLDDSAAGSVLAFVPAGRMYQPTSALAVLAALSARAFSGLCECYIQPDVRDGRYLMGVGLGFNGDFPGDAWWGAFADDM